MAATKMLTSSSEQEASNVHTTPPHTQHTGIVSHGGGTTDGLWLQVCKALNACAILNSLLIPTAATYPVDLTRTRLQIQTHQLRSANYRGALQTVAGVGT